jgi:hypothetical protein
MDCPGCGGTCDSAFKFCPHCGRAKPEPKALGSIDLKLSSPVAILGY